MNQPKKWFCILGSLLLLVMAAFHGSGFSYVRAAIEESNASGFLKDIVPVLFAHPSIHLIGLAAFGFLALTLKQDAPMVLLLLAMLVLADGLLAFYLGGVLPGVLLSLAAAFFVLAGLRKN